MTAGADVNAAEGAAGARGRRAWLPVFVFGAAYVVLYLAFFPPINAIMDESGYLTLAYALRHGTVFLETVGLSPPMSYEVAGHTVSQYPPGMAAILAGVSFLGWKTVLATNLLVHLTGYALIARVLKRIGVAPGYAVLYLLHPTAVIYSRTVMSDLTAALLVTLAFVCFLDRKYALVGAIIGASVLVRTANAALLVPFVAAVLLERGGGDGGAAGGPTLGGPTLARRLRDATIMGLCAVPFVAFGWVYQENIQDHGWTRYSSGVSFGLANVPKMLPGYVFAFLTLYPGMLLAPALYRGPGRGALAGLGYFCVLSYSCSAFADAAGSPVETFILGQRYVLVVIPLFLIAYSWCLSQLVARFRKPGTERVWVAGAGLIVVVLFATAGLMHARHQKYLYRAEFARKRLIATTPPGNVLYSNVHLAKLLHPAWGEPRTSRVMWLNRDDKNNYNELTLADIAKTLAEGKQVTVAVWGRKYRPEWENEARLLKMIRERFAATAPVEDVGPGGEDVLTVFRVLGEPIGATDTTAPPLPPAGAPGTTP